MGGPHDKHLPAKREGDEDDEVSQNPHPRLSQAESNLLALMAAGIQEKAPPPPPPPPKTWATAPVIIAMVVGIVSIGTSAGTQIVGYTQLGDRLSSFGDRMISHDGRIASLEKDFQTRGHSRDQELSTLTAANGLQDERLQNLTKALEQERQARIEAEADQRRGAADLRGVVNDLTKTLGDLRSDLKVLVDRAQRRASLEDESAELPKLGPHTNPR